MTTATDEMFSAAEAVKNDAQACHISIAKRGDNNTLESAFFAERKTASRSKSNRARYVAVSESKVRTTGLDRPFIAPMDAVSATETPRAKYWLHGTPARPIQRWVMRIWTCFNGSSVDARIANGARVMNKLDTVTFLSRQRS
jgi:hypothetical protein